jgi:hypothetical protein
MALSTASVVVDVNLELQNNVYHGTATEVGDGTTATYFVAPVGYYIVDDATFVVTKSGVAVAAADYTMDFTNGIFTFDTAPADDAALVWNFTYRPWNSTVVSSAVDYAVLASFPAFYVNTHEDLTPDGSTYEFDISDGEIVTRVMYRSGSTGAWALKQRKTYEVINDGTHTLRFWTAPPSGYLKVFYVTRPAITTIPERALPALISYACYYLITSKMAPRVRADVAVATQGTGTLSPRQMGDAANALYMRAQMQLAQTRMQPWSIS